MSIKSETLQLKVVVDTKEGINNLAYLEEQYKKIRDLQRFSGPTDGESYAKFDKQLTDINNKIIAQREELGLYGLTSKELQSKVKDLGLDLRDMIPDSEKAQEFRAEIEKIRQISSGKADAHEQKFREIDGLRLMIKESGTASLSIKQLETVGEHMFATMKSSAQAGNIENHQYYKEWQNINKAINQGKEALNKQKLAENAYQTELKETIKTQGIEAASLKDLREYHKLLQKEIQETTDFESTANKERIADAQRTKVLIDKKDGEVSGTTSFFEQIKQQLPSAVAGAFGGMFVGFAGAAAEAVTAAFSQAIDAVKKRARDITDIEVALNTTRANATKIKSDLNSIKTESSVDELKKLVIASGDLNVAQKDIKEFVVEADKVGVVIGPDFGGNVEEAITMIAKLKGEFKETRDMNYPEAIAKIGSTLKQLNLDGPASTEGITSFLKRVGAIPDAIKPTLPQLASFGAIFEEANLTAEISGSGFSKILMVAANNAALFGKQMGMTKKEVENLINTDPNQFVIKFAQSMKGLSGTDTAKSLKAVRLESDEVTKVVGVLTDNIDKLTRSQEVSNETFKKGTLTTEIFNKYLNDEAGQISQIEKAWGRVTNTFVNWLTKVSGPVILGLAKMSEKGKDLNEEFSDQKTKVENLTTKTQPLIDRYEELTKKTTKSKEDHSELNQLLTELQGQLPRTAFEFNNYGVAIGLNTEKAKDFIVVQKAMLKAQNATLINDLNNDTKSLESKLSNLQRISEGEFKYSEKFKKDMFIRSKSNLLENKAITPEEHKQQADLITDLQNKIKESKDAVRGLNGELLEVPELKKPPKSGGNTDGGTSSSTGVSDKDKSAAIAREKYLQESTKQMLDLQAKLAFEELQATSDEKQKRLNIVNKNAEDEIKRIETQFKNQKGIVLKHSQLSQEQKDLIQRERLQIERTQEEELVAIYDEFAQKREAQIQEQTNRAIQIAQDARKNALDNTLKTASKNGDNLGVFNAKYDIIGANESQDLSNLEAKHLKEKIALKDNKEALLLLEKNYGDERERITAKAIADRALLIQETNKNELDTAKKENLKKLGLDVTEAKQNGKDPKQAELALLDGQMAQELSVVGLTEEAKTNIVRDYALKRRAIEKEGAERTAETALEYFGKAFNSVTSLLKSELQNRTQAEQEHYDASVKNLESQKDNELLTSRQLAKQKKLLDKEHDREQRKLKREAFELDKAAAMSNIVIQTALAVMKAAPNIPLQIVTGVLGGIELGIAASQKAPPFDVGGALPDSFANPVDSKGGGLIIAHPGEYMIPKWIRQSPIFANIEPAIERMRTSGRSYEIGGPIFNSPNPTAPQVNGSIDLKKLETIVNSLTTSFSMFKETLQTPINAQVNFDEETTYNFTKKQTKLTQKLNDSYVNTNQSLIQ
jgi:hypothetical protein